MRLRSLKGQWFRLCHRWLPRSSSSSLGRCPSRHDVAVDGLGAEVEGDWLVDEYGGGIDGSEWSAREGDEWAHEPAVHVFVKCHHSGYVRGCGGELPDQRRMRNDKGPD